MIKSLILFFRHTFLDLGKQFHISYLPPLMIYVAAGAAFLAGLGFWAGIPWVLKMPLGHLVDLIWRHKNYLVFLGAGLIGASVYIMYALIIHTSFMASILPVETWFVISVILSPVGYVIQDVVADAMTVEAVPTIDEHGQSYSKENIKSMHITMQTLGRFAIISGTVLVALANIIIFSNTEGITEAEKIQLYGSVYLWALVIPFVSILGVFLSFYLRHQIEVRTVFLGSMSIVVFLMIRLIKELPHHLRFIIVGTAIIIFVFRAMPNPGPGLTWFEIDELKSLDPSWQIIPLLELL